MIDLTEASESYLIRHSGLHINRIAELSNQLEYFARQSDEAAAMSCCVKIKASCERIISACANEIVNEA